MIAELDRLGAGFAISQRDMDLRGAGDILGEQQVGHIRLVGVELYRHLLERAIAEVGGPVEREWAPELNLGVTGLIPPDYVADPEIRINLYARASRIRDLPDIDPIRRRGGGPVRANAASDAKSAPTRENS